MNSSFRKIATKLKDAYLISPFNVEDERGSFTKDFTSVCFKEFGLDANISEFFYSVNFKSNTLRGMHFSFKKPQAKIVSCLVGKIFDVIVDLRKDSQTYLQHECFILSSENKMSLYVPRGFAHGYLVLIPGIVAYKCCGDYFKEYDTGIIFDDPAIGIAWPLLNDSELIMSERDKKLPQYDEIKNKIEF